MFQSKDSLINIWYISILVVVKAHCVHCRIWFQIMKKKYFQWILWKDQSRILITDRYPKTEGFNGTYRLYPLSKMAIQNPWPRPFFEIIHHRSLKFNFVTEPQNQKYVMLKMLYLRIVYGYRNKTVGYQSWLLKRERDERWRRLNQCHGVCSGWSEV